MSGVIKLIAKVGDRPDPIQFVGRAAWCLDQLVDAGEAGITSLQNPAPRLSHYIFLLRKQGLTIETVHEGHSGPYSGHHGRYRLHTPVAILAREVAP